MVRIIDYKVRQRKEDGMEFCLLVLQGKPEFVRSLSTNKLYMTVRRATVAATFNEATCKELIGEKYPGSIKKIPCEEYQFTVPESGEVIKLNFRYEYSDEAESTEEAVFEVVQ